MKHRRLSTVLARGTDDLRALLRVSAAALDRGRPLLANLIVTRRCNLSCSYCHEYDRVSPPVPAAVLRARIDQLARLRTIMVTLTGGESLLHPDIVELVAYVRRRGMIPLVNTNGFLLTEELIEALGRAGLYGMQISVDNVAPSEASYKSLKTLRPKLELLAARARFRVRVSAVLGAGPPAEAVEVARTAMALGFDAKCQLVRDESGRFMEVDPAVRQAYAEIRALGRRAPRYLGEGFQDALLEHGSVDWSCRAGARYFHVDEYGKVQFCSSNKAPNKPLADYGPADIRRAFELPKPCAPTCTQPYAHQASRLDRFRPQRGAGAAARVHLPVVS